jgi:hypothetical protein
MAGGCGIHAPFFFFGSSQSENVEPHPFTTFYDSKKEANHIHSKLMIQYINTKYRFNKDGPDERYSKILKQLL